MVHHLQGVISANNTREARLVFAREHSRIWHGIVDAGRYARRNVIAQLELSRAWAGAWNLLWVHAPQGVKRQLLRRQPEAYRNIALDYLLYQQKDLTHLPGAPMLSDENFEVVMEQWSEWCLQGCQMGRGYPTASAHVNDYSDPSNGPVVLIDDDAKLERVEMAVSQTRRIKGVGRKVAKVLRAHYEAQEEYLHLSQPRRCKKLGLKPASYYRYLNIGKAAVNRTLSGMTP